MKFALTLLTVIMLGNVQLLRAADPENNWPNIAFICVDDLDFGDLACHGHPHIQAPSLGRLAREGMKD